jgi:hypothetical protein
MNFFNNPIERLRIEATKVSEFPQTLSRLQTQGSLSELASLIYSIYRCEHDKVAIKAENRLDYNLTQEQITAHGSLVTFKKHLKMAVNLIIEDVHNNFEGYKVTCITT